MKIQFEIDCTAREAREFFGLPDVQGLQQEMMDNIAEQMRAGTAGFDPATLMKPFMPEHLQSMEAMQRKFWESMSAQMQGQKKKS